MSIRITTTSQVSHTVLKVDGRLTAEDVDELTRVFRSIPGATALDLSDLQSADEASVEVLRQLVALNVEVRGASPYIALLLSRKK